MPDEKAKHWLSAATTKGFMENKGQMSDMNGLPVQFVLFKAEGPGLALYITETGLTYVFLKEEEEERSEFKSAKDPTAKQKARREEIKCRWERVDVKLKDSNIKKENILKGEAHPEHYNFFYGHCPNGIYGVKSYEKITIKDVYPGIDWVFYNSTKKGFKYDFIVHPGADHRQIQLVYSSKTTLDIAANGSLQLNTAYGNLTEQAPESFLNDLPIESKFKQLSFESNNHGGTEVNIGFDIPGLDSGKLPHGSLLIIDPALWWATFYGGTGSYDGPMSMDTDNNGNLFVTGYTDSPNFPVWNSGTYYQGVYVGGGADAFILKFDNAGTPLWGTYYGGSGYESGNSIATDASGNVFITGDTDSPDFPLCGTCPGFFQGVIGGGQDVFLLKFDNLGTRFWATYYGGNAWDVGYSIATDNNGNVFVTGHTLSTNFTVLNSGTFFQPSFGGGFNDVFILKFNNSCNLLWATWYGDSGNEVAHAIAIDVSGNVYITGYTDSPSFPVCSTCPGFFQNAYGGGSFDAFILKFDNAGNRLWATWYGGSGYDWGCSLVTNGNGSVYVAGYTESSNFPLQNSGTFYQGIYGGGQYDAFILKFDNLANRQWATFYGGSAYEYFWTFDNLAVDSCSNLYVSFTTQSTDLPTQVSCDGGYFDNSYNGAARDIALVAFDNNGTRLWATYIGGDGWDFREALALDGNNNLFVAGEWGSVVSNSTYPLANPGGTTYYDGTFNGGADDGYIMKFINAPCMCNIIPTVTVASQNILCNAQCTGTATANPSGGTMPYSYTWSNSQTSQIATGLCAGTYTVTITDAGSLTATATVTITEPPPITANTSSINTTCGNNNGSASVTASGGTGTLTYLWAPSGSTTTSISNLSTGTYTVTITDANNCIVTQTVNITGPQAISIIMNSTETSCVASTGTAAANPTGGTPAYSYLWNNGQTTQTATGLGAGTYTVTVTDAAGCSQTQSINVIIVNGPTATASASFTTITLGGNSQLTATGGGSYSWSPSTGLSCITCQNPIASPQQTTNYCVTITDTNGCTAIACLTILVEIPCGEEILKTLLPNAFSPNNDGTNDQLCIPANLCIDGFNLKIYDRWGEKVFESENLTKCWDGLFREKPLNSGVFVYYFVAKLIGGEPFSQKGNISLLR